MQNPNGAVSDLRQEFLEKFCNFLDQSRKQTIHVIQGSTFGFALGYFGFMGTLDEFLETWCETPTRLIRGFIEDLCSVGHNVALIEREAKKAWSMSDERLQEWINMVSIGSSEFPPRPLRAGDAEAIAKTVEKMASQLKDQFAQAQEDALRHARIPEASWSTQGNSRLQSEQFGGHGEKGAAKDGRA